MSNAFDKASLVMLPHAYEEGKLYSLKPTDRSGDFTFSRGTDTATRVNEQGYIEVVTDLNGPRLDYSGGATCPSLLLEPQRTNIARNDYGFNGFGGCTIASEVTTNPFGDTTDVFSATFTSGGGFRLNESPILVSGTTYCMGHFMKFNNSAITITASGASASILSASGSFSFDASGNPSKIGDVYFIEYPNGWYYVYALTNAIVDGGTRVNWNESSGSILVYKTQYEAGSYPTSYIPTNGSAQTRPKDVVIGAGDVNTFNSTEGVLYVEFNALADDRGGSGYIQLSDGTGGNRFYIGNSGAIDSKMSSVCVIGNALQWNINSSSNFDVTQFHKVALSYKENDITLYVDGQIQGTDTSAIMAPANTFNVLDFRAGLTANRYGKVKQVLYFPTALSEDEAKALTTL